MMRHRPSPSENPAILFALPGCRVALLLGVMAWCVAAAPSGADTTQVPAAAARGAHDLDGPVSPAVRARRPRPLAVEMQKLLDQERTTLTDLRARFAAARDVQVALQVQREIERVKRDTEIGLLRVQADFARRAGRPETALRIEAEIELILNPRPPVMMPALREPRTGAQR